MELERTPSHSGTSPVAERRMSQDMGARQLPPQMPSQSGNGNGNENALVDVALTV